VAQARQYILTQLKAAGITAREDAFDADTPLGRVHMVNVIATIPGTPSERDRAGDALRHEALQDIRFLGASDAASSTAAVLELGRALKTQQNEYTIELLFLDGEEAVSNGARATTPTGAATTCRRRRRPEHSAA
jgi:acetylornithine deacetylase/succinyl-diaminopimelate desuccinylase-like protein